MGRILTIAGLVIAAVVIGAWLLAQSWLNAALPDHSGRETVSGLSAPVEIIRDDRGVPHIFAATRDDLLFGQGYVHAQDRFFTMDFYRRAARGELAGLVGGADAVVETDILARTFDFTALARRDFDQLTPDARASLEAFAAGVNAYIADRTPGALALEYAVLDLGGLDPQITPWRADDSLAVARLMGFALSGRDMEAELERAAVRAAVSPDMYVQWRPPYDYARHPSVIRAADLPVIAEAAAMQGALTPPQGIAPTLPDRAAPEADRTNSGTTGGGGNGAGDAPRGGPPLPRSVALFDLIPFGAEGAGSNAWVVSGAHTQSGYPMLAVDPHNGIEMPNVWHEIRLNLRPVDGSEAFSIYGYAAAPFYLVLEGRNQYAAWGTTNVTGGDALDLYRLELDPENPDRYRYDGQWRTFETATVMLDIAGGDPREISIRRTHFGPVAPSDGQGPVHAIRWGGFEPSRIVEASLAIPFIKSFEDLRAAVEPWDYPPTHFVFAGRDGDIGIQQAGRFAIRAPGADFSLPQDGSTSATAWRGYLPYERMPYVKNPANGFLASGNNPAVPPEYFDAVAAVDAIDGSINYLEDGARGYRGARVEARLMADRPHDLASFAAIQTDTTPPGLADHLQPFAEIDLGQGQQSAAICQAGLGEWDGAFDADSAGALIFAHVWSETLEQVYRPHLPAGVSPRVGMTEMLSLETILADSQSGWWDDPDTPDRVEQRDDRLPAILGAACQILTGTYGDDRSTWRWDTAHGAMFENPVLDGSGIGPLMAIGNRGPVATFGGPGTVSVGRWRHGDGYGPVHIPGYRFVIDTGSIETFLTINSTGQSSHPRSRHYADQMQAWAQGDYVQRTLDEASLRERGDRLVLEPIARD
jgi:penicillin amidase